MSSGNLKDQELLFDPRIIPQQCHEALGDDFVLRPLASSDHARGHLELLSVLTVAPQLSTTTYSDTFQHLKSTKDTYFTIVIHQKSTDKVVACGTIIVEKKFVRSAGLGKKFGIRIINTLEEIGRVRGCYKVILDCSKENIPFYEKCGFKHKEYEMVRYLSDPPNIPKSSTQSRL